MKGNDREEMGRGAGRFSLLRLLLPLCHYGHFTETMTVKTQRFVTLKLQSKESSRYALLLLFFGAQLKERGALILGRQVGQLSRTNHQVW